MLARDGGMNVPNISQAPGSVALPVRTDATGENVALPRAHRSGSDPGTGRPGRGVVSFTRLAWFDANGDGRIDPRSATAGGDATLLVPADGVDLPTWSRAANPVGAARAGRDVGSTARPTTLNAAQAGRAADAYQRYGQTSPHTTAPASAGPPPVAPVPVASAPVAPAPVASAPVASAPVAPDVVAAAAATTSTSAAASGPSGLNP